jgi:hypothetical protein
MFLTDNERGGCWVYAGEDGMLDGLTCYAPNGDPSRVLCADRRGVQRAGSDHRLRRA